MEIKREPELRQTVLISTTLGGNLFEYSGLVYVKIDPSGMPDPDHKRHGLRLDNGEVTVFDINAHVYPLRGYVVVDL